jgi:rhamnosyltransferase subunit B
LPKKIMFEEDIMTRILLTTIGSSGDIHPFIAIGQALKSLGFEPVLGVPNYAVEKCHLAGLEAHGIFPDYETLATLIGDDPDTIVQNVMRSPDYLIRKVLLPTLAENAQKIDELADGVALVVSSTFVFAAPIIAQKRGLPIIPVVLQPLGIWSAVAPSLIPDVPLFARHTPGRFAQAWNKWLISVMHQVMLRRCRQTLDDVRRAHGLGSATTMPMFGFEGHVPLRLATYDPAFAALPADAPTDTQITGFPLFDSDSGHTETLSPELVAFLENGPPPIVFTLGSFAVYAPGNFYTESVKAARQLGLRAVLLIGPAGQMPDGPSNDVFVAAYAPHSQLFPRACCIVHHGGIGTTGQALLAGKPQLVVPFLGDQPDNADRIVGLGVGRQLSSKAYNSRRAAQLIKSLLVDGAAKSQAEEIAKHLIPDGALHAAQFIEGYLQSH